MTLKDAMNFPAFNRYIEARVALFMKEAQFCHISIEKEMVVKEDVDFARSRVLQLMAELEKEFDSMVPMPGHDAYPLYLAYQGVKLAKINIQAFGITPDSAWRLKTLSDSFEREVMQIV